jgi:excisionase family DNA binding protein
VLDVAGAMALLKLGQHAIYDGCGRGEIPHRRIGRLLRFSRAKLLAWLEGAS